MLPRGILVEVAAWCLLLTAASAASAEHCEARPVAQSAPVLLTMSQHLLKRSAVWVDTPEDDITKNLADSIQWGSRQIEAAIARNSSHRLYKAPGKVMGVALNSKDDIHTLQNALAIAIAGIALLWTTFSCQRKLCPAVYLKQERLQIEAMENPLPGTSEHFADEQFTYIDWFRKVWQITPEDEVSQSGLDGWAFLEFRRLNMRILSTVGPVLGVVLLPMHYAAHQDSQIELGVLSRLDIGKDPLPEWMLWIHVAVVWFVVAVSCVHINTAQERFTHRRYQWLKAVPYPRVTTVIVRNIPHVYRTDSALKKYFETVFSEDVVARAYIVRNTGDLPAQVTALQQARRLEASAAEAWQAAGRPAGRELEKIELDRCKHRTAMLHQEVARAQRVVEEGVERGDPAICSPTGFVTFTSELSQRLASREQYTREVTDFEMSEAPDPQDVIWANMAHDQVNSTTWDWVGMLAMLGVFVCWVPFIVLISSWTTLGALQEMLPHLKAVLQAHPWMDRLLSGVFATVVLKIFLAFLPTAMYLISRSFMSVQSGVAVQMQMQRWYGAFLVTFVLLVTSLGRGLTLTLVIVAQQPGRIFSLLAGYLPTASHFYFNYLILGWLIQCMELQRYGVFWRYTFYRIFLRMSEVDAKASAEPEDPASYGVGTRMASSLLTSAITFVFCSCSPLILVFSWMSFGLGTFAYKYLLVYAESRKPDSGGMLWITGVNNLFGVLCIYVLLMTGVVHMLGEQPRRWLGPPVAVLCALIVLYWSKWRVDNLVIAALPLEEVVRASRARTANERQLEGQYLQPECDAGVLDSPSKPQDSIVTTGHKQA